MRTETSSPSASPSTVVGPVTGAPSTRTVPEGSLVVAVTTSEPSDSSVVVAP